MANTAVMFIAQAVFLCLFKNIFRTLCLY